MIKLIYLILLFISGAAMAIEEPKYTVETKTAHYEIRKYSSVIVAETKVESEFDKAGNQAFRILADFIFGNNKSKTKISMTAPVSQQTVSEKIAMSAPVVQAKEATGFLVQFTMPQTFTMETLPEPIDPRVHIREIPERLLVVYRYSGTWSEERYNEKLKEFVAILKQDGVMTIGEPVFARYNSPYTLWFLRRNEIWIETIGKNKVKD